ncbi:macrophage mannose receptor 1-like [Acanthochromis polyacanthus]|uniref:macrophage mannose receptor 1-like n=1 Tax=Acanthochromis polyacanthus TaxID=80966 RepID=UPI002233EF19|nr:macrophage mannose receptor 1-like [Acanthochromis polyacanthus]
MDSIWLGVWCLSGWLVLPACSLRQYYFVKKPLTWNEAQTYCRQNYTDLATIENTEDVKELERTEDNRQFVLIQTSKSWSDAQKYCRENFVDLATVRNDNEQQKVWNKLLIKTAWIGLFGDPDLYWSDGSSFSWSNFNGSTPIGSMTDSCESLSCIMMDSIWLGVWCLSGWLVLPACSLRQYYFVNKPLTWNEAQTYCRQNYTDLATFENTEDVKELERTEDNRQFVLIQTSKSWSDAQKYCRENFVDLATVRNDNEQQKVWNKLLIKTAWIGLFGDPDLYWSDGSSFSWSNFNGSTPIGSMTASCGSMSLKRSMKWKLSNCEQRFPFVCHRVPDIRHGKVVKLRFELKDDSVDLNNPEVKAELLKKLQDRLEENGVSGVTLRWREQPDGKAFHKEETQGTCPATPQTAVC